MTTLNAYITFHSDKIADGIAACQIVREKSLLEPGCDRYNFFQSTDDPASFVFVEEWTTLADLELHFKEPAFLEFAGKLETLLVAPAEIRIFESTLNA